MLFEAWGSRHHHQYFPRTGVSSATINDFATSINLTSLPIDWDPRYLYRQFFDGDLEAVEQFLTRIGFTAWNLRQDQGRSFAIAVADLCAQFPQDAELIRAYDQRYEESIRGPIQPTVRILQALKQAGYPLYGLSNWPMEKFAIVRPKYEFFGWFEDIVISGEVKLAKPDPRIYALLLERIGRRAEDCLFIDDSSANISTADQLGFQTILYESPEQLETALRRLRLL